MFASVRRAAAVASALAALVATFGAVETVLPSGAASADVCASAGRRIYVSGCADLTPDINFYAPPPAYYAPLPEDFAPPPPPPVFYNNPNVNVCVGATGRRGNVSVSGCR